MIKQIESIYRDLFDKNADERKLENLRLSIADKKKFLDDLSKREMELEKISYSNENEIEKKNNLIEKISKMDICPLCKSKITKEHMESYSQGNTPKVEKLKKEI